jgi:chromosome segregation ATPase
MTDAARYQLMREVSGASNFDAKTDEAKQEIERMLVKADVVDQSLK